jgi:hypothetical protein
MKKLSQYKAVNESKPSMTKDQFKKRVKEDALEMQKDLKSQGANWPLSHCEKEVAKTLKDEYIITEAVNPDEISAGDIHKEEKPSGEQAGDPADIARKEAAKKGAEGSVDKDEKIKTHVFRYVGSDGDGLIFSQKRSEAKMKSENWQYLGEFSLPGALVNQLPRNEEKDEWRVVHKNG